MENSFKGDLDKRLEILKKLEENPLNKNRMNLRSGSCYTSINRIVKELSGLGMIERAEGNKKEHRYQITEKGKEFLSFF